jgi:hypothetical protein
MSTYLIAIPTYNRFKEIQNKTLKTLKEANIDKSKIYIFVANQEEFDLYSKNVPTELYYKIIIGEKGIVNQRNFISNYFEKEQYIISMDDDIEELQILENNKLIKLENINDFFIKNYELLKEKNLLIWGIYPVRNAFFMYDKITTDLRFIIGVMFGFIVNHKVILNLNSEVKEDYEQSILYYKLCGGLLRLNNVTIKTKFNAIGGIGVDRTNQNKIAVNYLLNSYPEFLKRKYRKNGTEELRIVKSEEVLS